MTSITAASPGVWLASAEVAAHALTGVAGVAALRMEDRAARPLVFHALEMEGNTMRNWLTALVLVSALGIAGPASGMEGTSFDDLDANKDGKLSKAEASKQAGLDFATADTNQDGWLNRAEYEAAVS